MEPESKELTQAEKRDFIERMTSLIENNILNRDDRKEIYCVCMVACDRELAKIKREGNDGNS